MSFYLVLPPLVLLLVVLQKSILDLFFFGRLDIELSLILVIYAGFRLDVLRGALLSFVAGFFMDCMTGSVSGIYTLFYVCVFFISRLLSARVYAEGTAWIMLFTFFCVLAEGLFIVAFYKAVYDANLLRNMIRVFLPQALILSFLSPVFFKLLRDIVGSPNEGNPQPAQRS